MRFVPKSNELLPVADSQAYSAHTRRNQAYPAILNRIFGLIEDFHLNLASERKKLGLRRLIFCVSLLNVRHGHWSLVNSQRKRRYLNSKVKRKKKHYVLPKSRSALCRSYSH